MRMFLCLAALAVLSPGPVRSEELAKPTAEETIAKAAAATGITVDLAAVVYRDHPALFESYGHAMFASKALRMISEAKDQEAAMEAVSYAMEQGLGKLRDKFLPTAFNGFLSVALAYKAALEALRDFVVVPKFDEAIYQAYKNSRKADAKFGDVSDESRETAFLTATTRSASGYFLVKGRILDDMIKAKGYDKENLGPEMLKKLERKIDEFWKSRLELRYQLDLLKSDRKGGAKGIWARTFGDHTAIREAAFKLDPCYGHGKDSADCKALDL